MSVIYHPTGKAQEFAPLAFNPYVGCSHGCEYCFAPKSVFIKRDKFYNDVKPKKEVLSRFRNELLKLKDEPNIPITFSFSCDPYQQIEEEYEITRRCIEMCIVQERPINILTKSNLVMRDFDLISKDTRNSIGMTLTFDNNEDSLVWEPRASLPFHRVFALLEAHIKGINTWVSIEPVIDPKQSLELISQTLNFVDHYKIGCLNYNKHANDIDWKDFRKKAEDLLKNKSYYITNSLAKRTA